MADRSSAWLVGALVLAAWRGPVAPPTEPPRLVGGVSIADRHLEHIESRIACMRRHGTPGLQPGTWELEESGLVKLRLAGGSDSYAAVMTVPATATARMARSGAIARQGRGGGLVHLVVKDR